MGGKMQEIVSTVKETTADIVACVETNTDTTRYDVRSNLYSQCSKLKTPQLTCSATPVKCETLFKPGGTMLLSSGPITSRLTDSGTDYLGRWSYQTFSGKYGIKNTIINCYQIPKQTPRKGRFTNCAQQDSHLLSLNRNCSNIRQLFYTELSTFLTALQKKEHELLLLGDFNDDLAEVNSGMARLLSRHKLHDLMRYAVGTTNISTYTRGSRRLDYALGSERFLLAFIQGGYERFGDRLKTDHRPYYLDFCTKLLFGVLHIHESCDQERFLRGRDVPKVTSYLKILHDKLEQQNAFNRMQDLSESDAPDHKLLETLDELYTTLALKVEYDERRRYNHEWSLKLVTQRAHVSVLKYYLAQFKTRVSHHESIQFLQAKYGPFQIPVTQKDCEKFLKEQQQVLHKEIKESVKTRVQELEERIKDLENEADEAAQADSKDKAKAIRQVLRAEQLKHLYRKIQRLRRSKKGVLHRLEVPIDPTDDPKAIADDADKWKILDTDEDMLSALKDRNRKHFGQAEHEGTTFFQEPFKTDVNYTATTASAEQILEGTYGTEELDQLTRELIQSMRKDHQWNCEDLLGYKSIEDRIKIWKEDTTTSPSGLHLGHYKALVNAHLHSSKDEEDEMRQEYDQYQIKLLTFRQQLLNYAIKWRYSIKRWKKVINRMIMKDPSNWKIHRLRVIHLYEADYSLMLALHWRSTLHLAEDKHLLNPGTYGSRPNRSAITPVFLEELMLEVTRLTRKNLIMFDHDAKSCYDRIVVSIMSLLSRYYGANKNVVIVWAKTLEEAKFFLKTGSKVNHEFYQHCQAFPIHGSGQGATNSPSGWLFISSKLFDVYDTNATGASFLSPDRSVQIKLYMIGFVDDTKSQTNDFERDPQPPLEDLAKTMEQDAQRWNDLLWRSGGALELSKCSFHSIGWQFHKGFPIMIGGKPQQRMTLHDNSGSQPIKALSAYKAHKTLGHFKAPNGGQYLQYEALKKKCKEHASFIQGNYLTAREVYTYYSGMYLPSVTYTLPNTFFRRKELKTLEKGAFNAIITKIGLCNKTHRSVVCGPISLGGRALRNLYLEQGCLQIKLLLTEARRCNAAGTLLFIALQWAQYTTGLETPLLEASSPCEYSESKWIRAIQQFLVENNISIEYAKSYLLPKQRVNDSYIMEHAVGLKYSIKELSQINHVRMYLQVLTVADLADAKGTHINKNIFYKGSKNHRETTHIKVQQEDPPSSSWNLWYEVIFSFCDSDGKLDAPLGDWTVKPADIRMKWEFMYSPSAECIIHTPTMQPLYHSSGFNINGSLPDDCIPIDSVGFVPTAIKVQSPPQVIYPLTLEETIQQLDQWEWALLKNAQVVPGTPLNLVLESFENGDIIFASDGSVASEIGTYGWVVARKSNGIRLLEGTGWAYGYKPSSYRAECYGGLALLRFIQLFCSYYNLSVPRGIKWLCDNESLVDTTKDGIPTTPLDELEQNQPGKNDVLPAVLQSDWDLLCQLIPLVKKNDVLPEWIQSHQDKKTPVELLPLEAQLNCRADKLASGLQLHQPPENITRVPVMPSAVVQVHRGENTITNKHLPTLRRMVTSEPLKKHIQRRNKWHESTTAKVDWGLHESITNKHQSCSYTKFLHKCLPVNKTLHRRNQLPSPICIRCGLVDESDDHVIGCPKSEEWRESLFTYYRTIGMQHKVDATLLEIIIEGITLHVKGRSLRASRYPHQYRQAITDQNEIGWDNWFRSRVATSLKLLFPKPVKKQSVLKLFLEHTATKWKELWSDRNAIVHGKAEGTVSQQRRLRAMAELDYIYARRHLYLPNDQERLFEKIEDHKALPLSSIQNWILLNKEFFQKSAKKARKRALRGVKRLTHFFKKK